ncbi:RHBD3 protein, partial [Amia calva]|nr:RHBD3 protein [Amia calva]
MPSLLSSAAIMVVFGQWQERRWGTVCFVALSLISSSIPGLLYSLLIYIGVGQPSPVCGYSATHFAMFSAQCRYIKQRRVFQWVPVSAVPCLVLGVHFLVLPTSPVLLYLCAICVGSSYSLSFVKWLQRGEELALFWFLPHKALVISSSRNYLPMSSTIQRPEMFPEPSYSQQTTPFQRTQWAEYQLPPVHWQSVASDLVAEEVLVMSEVQLLEEELLRVGILASLVDTPEAAADKAEVPKSSVSSLRLQQLEKMGFPTEKAVVALAATGKLDCAISLLIDGRVGEEAVVTAKGKTLPYQQPA